MFHSELNPFDEMIADVLLEAEAFGEDPNQRYLASLSKHRSLYVAAVECEAMKLMSEMSVTIQFSNAATNWTRPATHRNGDRIEGSPMIQIHVLLEPNEKLDKAQALENLFRRKPGNTRVRFLLQKSEDFEVELEVPMKVTPDAEFRAGVEAICGRSAFCEIVSLTTLCVSDGFPMRLQLEVPQALSVLLDRPNP